MNLRASRLEKLELELKRWKISFLDMSDKYADLIDAAGLNGHDVFGNSPDELHKKAIERISNALGKTKKDVGNDSHDQ